ncbi:hypothetical protein GCM10010121_098170 [Streptomyces brasiliensis]|uniref:Uncharacterized protein n=1 Tax=Streptomyces brasiliensis TaxID=1954 RepID=A0A917PDU3_9ACTN|nr:hypothetical protein GCM10010121_098170 [Streptomyces brasiliensis]
MLLGPALGGLIVGEWGVGGCYLIDALTFVAAIYGASGLPRMHPGDEPARPGLRGVLDGLAFLGRTPVIREALLTDLATTVLSMPISLFPLINAERFGGNPRTLGLFLTAIAVGGVAASFFSGTFTRLPRPGLVMLGGSAAWVSETDKPQLSEPVLTRLDDTPVICRASHMARDTPANGAVSLQGDSSQLRDLSAASLDENGHPRIRVATTYACPA